MALNIYFGISLALCITAFIFSLTVKRKNLGYILTTLLLIISDGICFRSFACDTVKEARDLYFLAYIIYAWMFFGVLWTIVKLYSGRGQNAYLIPLGVISFLQTILIIAIFNSPRTIIFTRETLFGGLWWVAVGAEGKFGLISFPVYIVLSFISALLILAFSVKCIVNSPKVFKARYVVLSVFQAVLLAVFILNFAFKWPMWIITMVMNPVWFFTYYLVFLQADFRLKDFAVASFANVMSDGLIVYNVYNDLIHVNDIIKKVVDKDTLAEMQSIDFMEDWLADMEIVEGIEVVPLKSGAWTFYYVVGKQILGNDKNFIGTLYTLRDVTPSINQIRLMEEINRELETSAKMKSDFLANMSHELRTPMNAVIGMAELALREELTPYAQDCLNQIRRSGRALLNIINDILDYSKIEAGKMEIIPEKYDPLSEVNDVSNILQTRIGKKPIELFFIVEPNLPRVLYGDALRIRQVIINIANNAIKFTETGSVGIYLTCEKKSDAEVILHFHVVDTGIGIKKEDLERIFVSFQQLDSKRNRNVEGTGLGLAISQKLIEAMDGQIGIESEYGRGTDVWFDVPQKVVDGKSDLVVQECENKAGFCMNPNDKMTAAFEKEMVAFGMEHYVIKSPEDYMPTGKTDYLFIEDNRYGADIEALLDKYPYLVCVVITAMGENLKIDRKDIRILSRPMSTLTMVMILNNQDITNYGHREEENTHFTAPDAKILIVDDNSINLSIAEGLLKPIKAKCTKVLSGAEALDVLSREHFDIILMDHMMPIMDGVETSEIIRRDIKSADDTPIVALTANVAEGSRELFLKAGMVDVIAKPIDVKTLMVKMHEWLPKDKIKEDELLKVTAVKEDETEEEAPFDCLDCKKGIEGLGSADLFKSIVAEYYGKGRKTFAGINEAKEKQDWKDYAIKTHSLKSTSRQIGAMELGALAEQLEHAGKAEDTDTIEKVHGEAMTMFEGLLTALSKYFPDAENEDTLPAISDDELYDLFSELTAACDELDMEKMEECGKRLREFSYPEEKQPLIESIIDAIASMDTDVIESLMKQY